MAMVEGGLFTEQEAAAVPPIHSGGSVAVTVYLSSNVDDVVQFLEDNGGDPRNVGEDYIEAYVPVSLLGQLSQQSGVTRVQEIIPPEPSYGNYVSQGVQEHNSQAWNNAGFSGQGVKVGVIDLGFEGLRSLIGSELLSNIQGRCYTDIGTSTDDLSNCEGVDDVTARFPECQEAAERSAALNAVHGAAVAESLIDMAPGASLYVANPPSRADLQDAVDWMASEGVTVINYSVGWVFDGPGDGTSPSSVSPLNTVDQAVARDVLWVNSAGNNADGTWFGRYSNPDGDGVLGFGDQNDVVIDLPIRECRGYRFQLRWEDSWEGAITDLDLHFVDKANGSIILSGDDVQSGQSGQIPRELFGIVRIPRENILKSTDFGLIVSHVGGPVPDWIQLEVQAPGAIEHFTVSGSITNPAESDNPGMLAVGATHYWDTHTIADYSSQGPTPDGRVKPDVVGVACGETVSYELYDRDGNDCWFAGTSQASPHVAGLAALVKQRFPHFTPDQTADYLKHYAEQRDTLDPNNTWGHGFAVLPPPGEELATGFDTSCWENLDGDGSVTGQWGPGCESAVKDRGHAKYYSFTLEQESEVTIDLTSSVDTYLYLREGDSRSGATVEGGENDDIDIDEGNTNSQIVLTLPAGSYTIEATTYAEGETGSFTLTMSGLTGTVAEPGADECEQIITGDGTVRGAWTEGCDSVARSGHHARYYRMTVSDEASVTIDLESEIDAYLFLRRGESRSGDSLNDHASDDDAGEGRNARVEETLEAGTYTIEATTYAAGETGNFTLTVSGLGGGTTPGTGEEACDTVPITGSVEGTWSEGCPSSVDARGYARYYSFTMSSEAEVTIDLTSTVDTYLYLRSGEARSGPTVEGGEDDDGGEGYNSQIVLTLPAGTYTIEATTYAEGQIGNFTLTVSGLSGTEDTSTDVCETETIDGDGSVNGTWADGCESEESGRGYARYYSFTLSSEAEVTIDLESSVDTYLYLREGSETSGTALHSNDDGGDGTNSRITATLAAGTYTIEATTYRPGETGSFTLTVSGLGGGT